MSRELEVLSALNNEIVQIGRSVSNCIISGTGDAYRGSLEFDLAEFFAALKMVILEVKLDEEKIMKLAEESFQRRYRLNLKSVLRP
jgi:hypothetical protein